jgi:hypothetical protein
MEGPHKIPHKIDPTRAVAFYHPPPSASHFSCRWPSTAPVPESNRIPDILDTRALKTRNAILHAMIRKVSLARPATGPQPIELVTAAGKPDSPRHMRGFRARGRKSPRWICTRWWCGSGAPSPKDASPGGCFWKWQSGHPSRLRRIRSATSCSD